MSDKDMDHFNFADLKTSISNEHLDLETLASDVILVK